VLLIIVGGVVMTTRSYYKQKINRRLRELEKQQAILQERERISKDIHDDLGAGLSTIAILSELVKRNAKQDDFTEKHLNKISEASRQLIENLGELIWTHNPTNDSLLKFLWYLREHLSGMFEGTSTTFQILIPENISDRHLQVEWRRNIFLITKEALHNVLKHAQATLVDLTVYVNRDSLIITIRDNGIGFTREEKMGKGNGLGNMEKRAKACGAELIIESHPGKGTALTISALLVS
jgi:signal transduction histidine kinase